MGVPSLVWIMGATCTGKKRFIQTYSFRHSWLECGHKPLTDLLTDYYRSDTVDLHVRWQWGRERRVWQLADRDPPVPQRIILLTCDPTIQAERAASREGHEHWTPHLLAGEAREVEHLARQLSDRCGLDLQVIDFTKGEI